MKHPFWLQSYDTRKKLQKHKPMEAKHYASKQSMGH